MKKLMIFIFLLLALALGESIKATELIGLAGAGVFHDVGYYRHSNSGLMAGDYEFVEARLMFFHKLRVGPMANYTWVYVAKDNKDSRYSYKGRFYTLGLSADNWGKVIGLNYYFWLNSGIRWSYDRGASSSYYSWQKDKLFLLQAGLRLTRLASDWFGNNLFIAEWQTPIENGNNRYSVTPGIVQPGKPTPKGSFRLTYENGLKKFAFSTKNKQIRFEPIGHLGYGSERAYTRQYYEYGGGFAFSYFKEWQRELAKFKVYRRQDFGGYHPEINDGSQMASWHFEVVINVLNLKFKK